MGDIPSELGGWHEHLSYPHNTLLVSTTIKYMYGSISLSLSLSLRDPVRQEATEVSCLLNWERDLPNSRRNSSKIERNHHHFLPGCSPRSVG